MKVQIHRGPLECMDLVREIAMHGYVAFVSTRTHQRELAGEIREQMDSAGRSVRTGEAFSPDFPMCVVDTEWHDYVAVLAAVAKEDDRWAREQGYIAG